jgi:hypothetical protein
MTPSSKSKTEPPENLDEFLRLHGKEIGGSLCIFGDWFGRPMDNWHRVVSFEVKEDYIKLTFNEGEILDVWGAKGLKIEGKSFVIRQANHIRWEWFYYGRAKLPENRFFLKYVVNGGEIEATSNVTWYKPDFQPSLMKPAVLLQ